MLKMAARIINIKLAVSPLPLLSPSAQIKTILEYAFPNDEVGYTLLAELVKANSSSGRGRSSRYVLWCLSMQGTPNKVTDLQHHLYSLTLDGRLFLSPIEQNVRNVLDIGTGTGIWAIEFGAYPKQLFTCSVTDAT